MISEIYITKCFLIGLTFFMQFPSWKGIKILSFEVKGIKTSPPNLLPLSEILLVAIPLGTRHPKIFKEFIIYCCCG